MVMYVWCTWSTIINLVTHTRPHRVCVTVQRFQFNIAVLIVDCQQTGQHCVNVTLQQLITEGRQFYIPCYLWLFMLLLL